MKIFGYTPNMKPLNHPRRSRKKLCVEKAPENTAAPEAAIVFQKWKSTLFQTGGF
jgi:hypothetical protein